MPFEYSIEASSGLVVVTGSGQVTMEQRRAVVQEILESRDIQDGARFLFVVGGVENNMTPEEMGETQKLIQLLFRRFRSRIAIVNTRPGHVTTTVMVTIMAGNDSIRSFMDEGMAREWLLSP